MTFCASFLLIQWLTPVSTSITFKFENSWLSLVGGGVTSTSAMNQFRESFIFASRSLHTITISPGIMSINLIVLPSFLRLDSSALCKFCQRGWSLDLSGRRDNAVPPALLLVMARIFEFLKSSCAHFLELLDLNFLPLVLSRFWALRAYLLYAFIPFVPFRVLFLLVVIVWWIRSAHQEVLLGWPDGVWTRGS